MQGLRAYLTLRWLTLGRQLREIGWVRLLILLPMLGIAVVRGALLAATSRQGQWVLPIVLVLLLASAHRQRADLRFLAAAAPAYRRWLAVENLLWALPAVLLLLFFGDWGAALLAIVLAPLVATVPPAREGRPKRHRAQSFFRSEAFEWVSGMRRGGWLWLVLLAGALWMHDSPLAPVLSLAVWLFVILVCYGGVEPFTMLMLAAPSPGRFLRRRLVLGMSYAALSAAPFLWLLACGTAGPGGALAVGLAWLGMVGLLILTKYAFYPNTMHIRFSQALLVAVALVLPGHPVYPVLLLVAVGGLIWQSQRRMRRLLASSTTSLIS